MHQRENPLFNLAFNILIPIVILNKGHEFFDELFGNQSGVLVLLLALFFPLFYGLFDFLKNKRKNLISAFGILNVLFTGGLALYKLDGIWFAVKEASFPLLIGVFIFISAYTKKNFFEYLTRSSHLLRWDLLEEKKHISSFNDSLKRLFKQSTILFSLSFFISAVLNFFLALHIFAEKELAEVSSKQKEIILNQKIADMTWLGFLVIGLPMTIFAIGILWWFLKKLKKITGLSLEQILTTKKAP